MRSATPTTGSPSAGATARAGRWRSWPPPAPSSPAASRCCSWARRRARPCSSGRTTAASAADTAPTWWDDRLPLGAYETDPGRAKVLGWYERMLEIRRGDLGRLAAGDIAITHLNDANGIVAFTRDGGKYAVVLNFRGTSWEHYDVGVRGRYQELANTSWPAFNLGGYPERSRGGEAAHDDHGRRHPGLRRGGAGPVGLTWHGSIASALDTLANRHRHARNRFGGRRSERILGCSVPARTDGRRAHGRRMGAAGSRAGLRDLAA